VKAWIDIENPPQARYLLPLARRLAQAGCDVVLTARQHDPTLAILRSEGVSFLPVGQSAARSKFQKVYGVLQRTRLLLGALRQQLPSVDLVLSASRAAALAARRLKIPSFVVIDYEYVNLTVFRLAGSYLVHPGVISASEFELRGIRPDRLMPFPGLKEDLSFADVDLTKVSPYAFQTDAAPIRVLFRPPAEESHYHRAASGDLAQQLLHQIASKDLQLVFSPRYDWQIRQVDEVSTWRHEPVVLREPVGFVSLLKAVDAVISGGGTMAREAAFLGIPSYSIFRGHLGAVDRCLVSMDRLKLVSSASYFADVRLVPKTAVAPLRSGPAIANDLSKMILQSASAWRAA
jgi:predicted glycosyltransferase